jgi:hypothetical protein
MSTQLKQFDHSWPCYCGDAACGEIPVHNFALEEWRTKQVWQFMLIVTGQREVAGLRDNGWHTAFCVEDDGHMETALCSLEAFANQLVDEGWGIESLERSQAICPKCQQVEPELSERDEWEDAKVYEARK